ncbi:MAG: hypothetical protein ABFC98_04400 [Candidatus Cloacimonas sp.]
MTKLTNSLPQHTLIAVSIPFLNGLHTPNTLPLHTLLTVSIPFLNGLHTLKTLPLHTLLTAPLSFCHPFFYLSLTDLSNAPRFDAVCLSDPFYYNFRVSTARIISSSATISPYSQQELITTYPKMLFYCPGIFPLCCIDIAVTFP